MRLHHALALGLLLPLAALGAADLGRLIAKSPPNLIDADCTDDPPVPCKPYDPSCTEHGLGNDEDEDSTDTGVGCVDDCLDVLCWRTIDNVVACGSLDAQ